MATSPGQRRRAGRRAAQDGMPRAAPERYFTQNYINDWLEGYDREMETLELERAEHRRAYDEAARFFNVEVTPLAERLGVPADALLDLVDLIVARIKEQRT